MYKLFLPYDVFERHKKVGSMIDSDQTVVDIGGELNHLSQFCSPKKIIVANLSSGDIIISEDKLPFKRKSFDVVCAIDVIEHIPKKNRKIFLENLLEIASQKVILSFPIGTKRHIAYEKEIQTWLMKKGEKTLEEKLGKSIVLKSAVIGGTYGTSYGTIGALEKEKHTFADVTKGAILGGGGGIVGGAILGKIFNVLSRKALGKKIAQEIIQEEAPVSQKMLTEGFNYGNVVESFVPISGTKKITNIFYI